MAGNDRGCGHGGFGQRWPSWRAFLRKSTSRMESLSDASLGDKAQQLGILMGTP
jgi:hypothetical protein